MTAITKAQLVETIQDCTGCTQTAAIRALDQLLDQIEIAAAAGDDVVIRNFGTFKRSTLKTQALRNPKTGEALPAIPSYRILFRPGKELKARLAKAAARDSLRQAAE